MKSIRINSRIRLVTALSLVLAVYAFLILPSTALAVNRVIESGAVKVFIGSSRATGPLNANSYTVERHHLLNKLAGNNPDTVYSAIVVFDDYYSAQDVEEFAKKENIVVSRTYLWAPGETGRASLGVENNDVQSAIARSYNRAKGLEGTEDFGSAEKDFIRIINGKYGIFSVTIAASAEKLNKIRSNESVEFIDVKYSEEGEKIAAGKGVNVQYIELPYKPDRAL